ncbi:glycoside hydrolase family 97 protein [Alistipes sp. ZOR0009]|uniref:glycoside hydrolase family 97 protein n=1 Tax=Alistipes sp. ZOR0009 TaxID=1339253 RepID=UPI00064814D7|nr:glycoside hydrolase family 97 protein [Alistipes sp. ZOR0009]
MRKILIALLGVLSISSIANAQKRYVLTSPDKQITATITAGDTLTYKVDYKGETVLQPSKLTLTFGGLKTFGVKPKVANAKQTSVDEIIDAVVAQKSSKIADSYNQLTIKFRRGYAIAFRAYNDGVAYRWQTTIKGEHIVKDELVEFAFPDKAKLWFPEEKSIYSHQERKYSYINLAEVGPTRFGSTGMLVDLGKAKVYLSESDLEEYPGMFLRGSASKPNSLIGKFAGYPLEVKSKSDRDEVVTQYADFLAKTAGSRTFPWRLMVITDNDIKLAESMMVYKLASENRIKDPSWIKPGKVAWDWWNDLNIYNTEIKSGVNTETYKYYIDFASRYGLRYIILDEGWYHLEDVLKVKKEVNIEELISYGKSKNVDIILWVTWKALNEKMDEALTQFEKWGVKGIKVDFMQRDDQKMVEFYYTTASKAAEHKLLVDYHGAYKPTGLQRTFPNVISFEGVYGLEQNKWTDDETVDHNVTLPFIRMVAGPMDFTPGAMLNATKDEFKANWSRPMAYGTRCHQLGMYVIYESPLQMLADSPSNYYHEPAAMDFLSKVPTVWDQTIGIDGKVGDFIIMARRSGSQWYIGGMTDWTSRDATIKLDFLPEGEHTLTLWQDGPNADKAAVDCITKKITVSKGQTITIPMAKGGGFVGIIE